MRRKILLAVLLLLLAAGAGLWWWTRPLPVLTVTTWAGVYGRAQAASQMQPYGAEHRVMAGPRRGEGTGILAVAQQHDAVADLEDLVEEMRNEDDGDAARL